MSTYKPTVIIAGRENQLDDPDGLDVAHLANVDYVQFDLLYADGSVEGRLQWNMEDGTLEVGMPGGNVTLQIGQEQLVRCRNITGNTINNGSAVYISGQAGNKPLIALSKADDKSTAIVFGVATETITSNSNGFVNVGGMVRSINTYGLVEGGFIFLSANTAGGFETFPAEAPSFKARVGWCLRTHNSEGAILVHAIVAPRLVSLSDCYGAPADDGDHMTWVTANSRFEVTATKSSFHNGTFRESFDFLLSSNGTAITASLEQSGGGDLTMQFDAGETTLNCTPAQTLNIPPGTDSNPIGCMAFIPQDTKTLTLDTSWPAFTQHIKVAYILVPSATYVQDHLGGYVNQNWNDHLSAGGGTGNNQGHLAHTGVRIRQMGADWYSGVNPDGASDSYFTINTGNVHWQSTEGLVSQFHPHIFTATDTTGTDLAIVVNDPDSTYNHVQNLYTSITKDSTGSTISNNRYFNLVFWGVANKTGDGDLIMVNLPSGVYTIESSAILDTGSYDNFNFPREFDIESGTAFLICRVTFKMGSNDWTWVQTEDLRGLSPSKVAGGIGTSDHGSLGGLADDDHTQYALVDGTRAFTGNVAVQGVVNAQAYDTGNYRIDETSSRLQFINQLNSGDTNFDFMPDKNGGEGDDDVFFNIWATGGISAEYLKIGYESDLSPQRYVFETYAITAGVHHPIYFAHSGSDVMTIDSNGLNILSEAEITSNPDSEATTVKDIAAQEWDGAQTGTIKIQVGWFATRAMLHIVIRGYNHVSDFPGAWELHFGGYDRDAGPDWRALGCFVLGNPPFQSVRCGFESGYPVILLGLDGQTGGETATAWNYPWVEIESVTAPATFGGPDISGKGPAWTFDISDDEVTDWPGITGLQACPMHIAPGMEITDNGDGAVNWELTGGSLTIDGAATTKILNIDKTIYLRTTGDDSNGGYASDDAFLTPGRVVTELRKWQVGDYLLSIEVGEGTFNCTSAVEPSHPEGSSLIWTGAATGYTNRTINNIDASTTNLATGLKYIDFDVSLPAESGAAVDQYILIKTTSGGANPNLVKGCHKIVTWNGTNNVATVRCARTDSSTLLPSGIITANTLTLVKSVFSFSGDNGIFSSSALHCGHWDRLVLEGGVDYVGVWVLGHSTIVIGPNFGTSNWGTNVQCQHNATLSAVTSVHSYSHGYLATVSDSGSLSLSGAILSGGAILAARAYDGGVLIFQGGEVYCGGHPYNVQALRGGYITATFSNIEGCIAGSVAFYASSGGGIVAQGSTTDAPLPYDTGAAPGGNGAYVAY